MAITVLHTASLNRPDEDALIAETGGQLQWLGSFYHLVTAEPLSADCLERLRNHYAFDVNPLPDSFCAEQVKLVLTDMDSTLIPIECIDEIADFAGKKAEVSAVTESAMRGEIDFKTSLIQRVAVLGGLDEEVLSRVYEERLTLNPGALELIAGLHHQGVAIAVVSGGFTFFTERIRQHHGLDFSHANTLETVDGQLTGRVLGEIVDGQGKADYLRELCDQMSITPKQVVAVGDGANDLIMMSAAGLGVAYHAKPKVQRQADVAINHGDLRSIMDILGIVAE